MKLTVANLSSSLLNVPAPFNVTLRAGQQVVVALSDAQKAQADASEPIRRIVRAKMLGLSPFVEPPAKAQKPAPKVEEPAPAPAPAEEPAAEETAPAEEPAADLDAADAPQATSTEGEPEEAPAEEEAPKAASTKGGKRKKKFSE